MSTVKSYGLGGNFLTKQIYIASYCGPHSKKQEALNELARSLSSIFHRQRSNMSNVTIGGDFYVADINWDAWSATKPSTATYHIYFLKFLLENSLSQLGKVVTRPFSNSILDLPTATNPYLVSNIKTHTGISDHLLFCYSQEFFMQMLTSALKKMKQSRQENYLTSRKLTPVISF